MNKKYWDEKYYSLVARFDESDTFKKEMIDILKQIALDQREADIKAIKEECGYNLDVQMAIDAIRGSEIK